MGYKRIAVHKFISGVENKWCNKCLNWKPVTGFHTGNSRWDKLYPYCKSCVSIISKQWRENNPDYEKQRRENNSDTIFFTHIKRIYGINSEEWTNIYRSQHGKCAICRNPFKDTNDCHTDHNHNTGQLRQLLCSHCNHLIGFVHEDVSILASMINYLKVETYNYTYFRNIAKTARGKLITRNICINQDWVCAICGKSLIDTKVCLDHDNKLIENNIRGCLDDQCNMALGQCHDDIKIIRSAIAYLNHWELQYYLDKVIQSNKNGKEIAG